MSLLEVRQLSVRFPVRRGLFGGVRAWLRAVDRVDLEIQTGETVGLVGESGCGKSTLGRAILRLIEPADGQIIWKDTDITTLSGRELRQWRRQAQIIFQDPINSLDPRQTVGDAIGEALDVHKLAPNRRERQNRIAALMESVGLDPSRASDYPHEFSGGQRQRIGIARALAVQPDLIVCDEPVSALDVSIQAQIVNLLLDLQKTRGIAYLFIAHDLALVEHISRRVLVMYLGRIVESADAAELLHQPLHPYTQALISAVPVLDPDSRRKRIILGGEVPSPINPPPGCAFHPRCPWAEPKCKSIAPVLREVKKGHKAACHLITADNSTPGNPTATNT
ncbi:MAG TPA: ABC transporter ATP-binding protein [Verrucomicrobiota bacterium]|nr:ABC transporter ATP-binding protein [Verrucomicrobiota bacterium]